MKGNHATFRFPTAKTIVKKHVFPEGQVFPRCFNVLNTVRQHTSRSFLTQHCRLAEKMNLILTYFSCWCDHVKTLSVKYLGVLTDTWPEHIWNSAAPRNTTNIHISRTTTRRPKTSSPTCCPCPSGYHVDKYDIFIVETFDVSFILLPVGYIMGFLLEAARRKSMLLATPVPRLLLPPSDSAKLLIIEVLPSMCKYELSNRCIEPAGRRRCSYY